MQGLQCQGLALHHFHNLWLTSQTGSSPLSEGHSAKPVSTLPAAEPGICLLGKNLMGGLVRLPTPRTHMVQRGGFDAGGGIVRDIIADSSTGSM